VRPAKQPNVSAPIDWGELNTNIRPSDFTVENMLTRLHQKGDLWKDLHHPKIKSKNTKILYEFL